MTREVEREPSSLRDPAGFVYSRGGTVLRQVEPSYLPHYEALRSTGLFDELISAGLLLPAEEVSLDQAATGTAARVLRPERVPFLSYCYEWPFSLYQDAALLTLEVQRRALKRGLTLKDATPYNVQLVDGRVVLIDHLSFELREEGSPWVAYRQFCESFLAPLVLMATRDARLRDLLRVHYEGIPLDLAASLLPLRSRLQLSNLLHLQLHGWLASRKRSSHDGGGWPSGRALGARGLERLIDDLERSIRSLDFEGGEGVWTDYAVTDSYDVEAGRAKREVVAQLVRELRPETVWDLGGNKGEFAQIAEEEGARVVTLDSDAASVDLTYRRLVRSEDRRVVPLLMDLVNPSPSLGWRLHERPSLLERGPAQMVMALALVHHLVLHRSFPLSAVARMLAEFGEQLIVEHVPPSDPQVRRMMSAKPGRSHPIDEATFVAAFERVGKIRERHCLPGSDRVLYRVEVES